jgi:CheY-like chemotaxis protein
MPRLGGLEALTRIRALDPTIKIVVITALDDPALHERARALGASAVLVKPFEIRAVIAAVSSTPPNGRGKAAGRVLVVDDDPEIRAVLEEFLAGEGLETVAAGDGGSGLRAVIERMPHVVLLDINMPGLNGVEALAAIRAAASDVSVIMISGSDDLELAKRALAYGAFDYLAKPIDFGYLRQSIEAALMMKHLET